MRRSAVQQYGVHLVPYRGVKWAGLLALGQCAAALPRHDTAQHEHQAWHGPAWLGPTETPPI